MINIQKQLWWVVKSGHDDNLSYMCPFEVTKTGEPTAGTKKMQGTGIQWAREYGNKTPVSGNIADNIPMTGFYIGDSVSRWTTSNKLFRVVDPRGFTVEVPTGNIATLLHHTTVSKGVVQEECVWGRDGANHILLPINSEPYLKTLDQMATLKNDLIPVKDLCVGDVVNFFEDKSEYYYAGMVKFTWDVWTEVPERYYYSYNSDRKVTISEKVRIEEDKWVHVFLIKVSSKPGKYITQTPSSPKIVKVLRNEKIVITKDNIADYHSAPQRVLKRANISADVAYYHVKSALIDIQFKNQ